MLWSSVEPVSMETVASKAESSPNGYLMIPDALSLAQSVTKQHAWLHALAHLSVFCQFLLGSLRPVVSLQRGFSFLFFCSHQWSTVINCFYCSLNPTYTLTLHHVCRLQQAGCLSWALLTSAHLPDITAQRCRMPCDGGAERDLLCGGSSAGFPPGCGTASLSLLVEDLLFLLTARIKRNVCERGLHSADSREPGCASVSNYSCSFCFQFNKWNSCRFSWVVF